jgi:hypothetical protein
VAIPTANCADGVSPDVACSSTWLIGERIRTVAFEGLCGCDCDIQFRSYTVIGNQIQDPIGNSLISTMLGLGPVSTTASGALPIVATHRARYLLELRDVGWPTIEVDEEGNYILIPDSSEFNAASKHAQSHGETMYRSLVNAIQRRTLFASALHPHIVSESIRLSELTPISPQAIQVGWSVNVDVPLRL